MIQDLSPGTSMHDGKKVWQEPTLTIIDQSNVSGGPVDLVVEQTVPSVTASHHS